MKGMGALLRNRCRPGRTGAESREESASTRSRNERALLPLIVRSEGPTRQRGIGQTA